MRFLGEYRDEINNGKVEFPWNVSNDDKLIWMIVEVTKNGVASLFCEIYNSDEFEKEFIEKEKRVDKIRILSKGNLFLDDYDVWQIPEDIMKYLKTNEITFVGAFSFVEILSSEDMERYEKLLCESLG